MVVEAGSKIKTCYNRRGKGCEKALNQTSWCHYTLKMVMANEEKLSAEGVQSTWVWILLPFDRILYSQDLFFTRLKCRLWEHTSQVTKSVKAVLYIG